MLKVAQIADLHIRNYKRHSEYRKSFENLYESLKEKKPDIIALVGDISHGKTLVSCEYFQLCSEFIKSLSEIAPVHITPGNHDLSLSNLSKLDAITPVVNNINSDRIFYHKKSGIYNFGFEDYRFVVFSCFDANWPQKENIDATKVNIGLYHGMVQGAILQNGEVVEEESAKNLRDFLDVVDYLMLGDIHEMQILDMGYRAAYCGSTIMQNYGESKKKGYIVWTIPPKNASVSHDVDFIQLPNVCPYETIDLDDSLIVDPNLGIQKGSRIRVFSRQCSIYEKKNIEDKLSLYEPTEVIFADIVNPDRQEIKIGKTQSSIEDISNLDVQEKLITEFLSPLKLTEEKIKKVCEINKKYNVSARNEDDVLRNILYKILRIQFSNTFSYGEDNEFDFTKHKGLVGIFGKSAVGKSSLIVDVPLYCMFNRISKKGVVKNDLIINESKDKCFASIDISIGNDVYKIERETSVYLKTGKKAGDPVYQGKTEVRFKLNQNGIEVDKNGDDRSKTDDNIQQIFGTIDDFISTSMAPQWQLLGIIDCGGTERQKLIGRYFDIDIFETKYNLAKEQWKEIKSQLKIYQDRNFIEEIKKINEQIFVLIQKEKSLVDENAILTSKKEEFEKNISDLSSQILNVSSSNIKKEELQYEKDTLENKIKNIEEKRKEALALYEKKKNYDISSLTKKKDLWKKVQELKDRAFSLKNGCNCNHEETCPIEQNVQKLLKDANSIENNIDLSLNKIETSIIEWKNIKVDESALHSDDLIFEMKKRLASINENLQKNEENKKILEKNNELLNDINELKSNCKLIHNEWNKKLGVIIKVGLEISHLKDSLKELENSKKKYDDLCSEFALYDYFLTSMSKDGIAKKIIADNIGIINGEIKKILADVVNFDIELASEDNGKAIEIYYVRNGKKRRVELLSGMEKTLAALSLRVALINITTLPKSNIFVLDECFGFLDAEYKDCIQKFLTKLKNIFESVFIITHDDYLKDFVDHSIEIYRNDVGFSKIGV